MKNNLNHLLDNSVTHTRFLEDYNYNIKLNALTKFNYLNNFNQKKLVKIILNFSFKNIQFDKKKVIPFFLTLELISNQKCSITTAKRAVLGLKIRKGVMTGCKVTLRNKNLYKFLDHLVLALPRSESFKGFSLNALTKNVSVDFSTHLNELFMFYQAESEINSYINKLDITFVTNTKCFEEKAFLLTSHSLPLVKLKR